MAMTPARVWPRGFKGPSYPAVVEMDRPESGSGRITVASADVPGFGDCWWSGASILMDRPGERCLIQLCPIEEPEDSPTRTATFGEWGIYIWEKAPPWPDRTDERPVFPEDFYA